MRLAPILFWSAIGLPVAFFGVVFLAGRERASPPQVAKSCTTKAEAIAAAQKFHGKFGGPTAARALIVRDGGDGRIYVTLGTIQHAVPYSVFPDCTVKFA